MTECNRQPYLFQAENRKEVVGRFDGGKISSDAGLILIRELERSSGILKAYASCFLDLRNPELIQHSVDSLVSQRVYGLISGNEDLNDHETLRGDPLFEVCVGKKDLAGKSTLNRLELTPKGATSWDRYKKIELQDAKARRFFVDQYVRLNRKKPRVIIIDVDAHAAPVYGHQEERFFHGFYNCYCYLPLFAFVGDHLVWAELRPSNIDGSKGTVELLKEIVPIIKAHYPKARIMVRGDSGFAREAIMAWCEGNNVDYLFGLAQNERLRAEIADELLEAEAMFNRTRCPARVFRDFRYQTLDSWNRARRVVGKAEHLDKGSNPRFIVTSLSKKAARAMKLYEQWYCQRGDMENRIKEQLSLFSDRLSCQTKRANQVRLSFAAVAYVLMAEFRRRALRHTTLAKAHFDTIRLKLFKLAAKVTESVRRIVLSFSEHYPSQDIFAQALHALQNS